MKISHTHTHTHAWTHTHTACLVKSGGLTQPLCFSLAQYAAVPHLAALASIRYLVPDWLRASRVQLRLRNALPLGGFERAMACCTECSSGVSADCVVVWLGCLCWLVQQRPLCFLCAGCKHVGLARLFGLDFSCLEWEWEGARVCVCVCVYVCVHARL